jgi:ribosome biogenesis GTPase
VKQWGWDEHFENLWKERAEAAGVIPARITAEHRDLYILAAEDGEHQARLSGRFRHEALLRSDLPTVGDWVAVELPENSEQAVIHGLLPRRSKISRKEPGRRIEEQVVAANVDTVFLVTGLDGDFNLRRIERYLVLSHANGAAPVVVLTKSDLHADCGPFIAEAQAVASGAPVIAVSNPMGSGFAALEEHLVAGRTVALLGSSGAGKSSIINRLLGCEKQAVLPVRQDDSSGRHATTHRELFILPNGALMIDNPGLRELQLWETEGLEDSFPEIRALAEACRYRSCRHEEEPGCAVREALKDGRLPEDRFAGYVKLRKEQAYLERKTDTRAMQEHKKHWKKISKLSKEIKRFKKPLGPWENGSV